MVQFVGSGRGGRHDLEAARVERACQAFNRAALARGVLALEAQYERHAALVQLAVEFGQALLQLLQFRAVLFFID